MLCNVAVMNINDLRARDIRLFGFDPNDRNYIEMALHKAEPANVVCIEFQERLGLLRATFHDLLHRRPHAKEMTISRPDTALEKIVIERFRMELSSQGYEISVRIF